MNSIARQTRWRAATADALLALAALAATLALSALVALATATEADAASLVYIGADHNVHLVSPDGRRKFQLTTDGDAENPYRSPSQADSGRVVALRKASSSAGLAVFIERDGRQTDAWNLPASGTGLRFAPFNGGQISPEGDGGMLVYDYWHAEGPPTYSSDVRVGFASGPGMTNPCLINCHGGYLRPRWLPGTPHAGFVAENFARVDIQRSGSAQPQGWIQLNDSNFSLESFDVARTRNRLVVEVSRNADGRSSFGLFRLPQGPGGDFELICEIQYVAPATAYPRLSPDGSMIAWTGADGVYVVPTPTTSAGGVCQGVQPRLVARGGKEADWGKADVPGSNGPQNPNAPTGPIAPTGRPKLGDALKNGLTVRLQCPEACEATVKASVAKRVAKRLRLGRKPTTVARGKGSGAEAGPVEVTLRFKGKAKRKLKRAKSVKLALAAKLRLASGSTKKLKSSLKLKR